MRRASARIVPASAPALECREHPQRMRMTLPLFRRPARRMTDNMWDRQKSPSSAGTTAIARSSPPGGSGAAFVLERELELDTIRQRLARLDMHVLLDHADDAQIPQRARSLLDGCGCRLLPGLIAVAPQRNPLVHALFCHAVLPSGILARRGVSHRRTGALAPRRAIRSITLRTNALATLPSLLARYRAHSRACSRGRFARFDFG